MKIKIILLAIVAVWLFSGRSCWAKDLGTITLRQQPSTKIISLNPIPPFSISSSVSQNPSSSLNNKLTDLIDRWRSMANKISKRLGVEWNSELGIVLSHSKSKEIGIKVSGDDLKFSISRSNGRMVITGISSEKGIYTGYQFSF